MSIKLYASPLIATTGLDLVGFARPNLRYNLLQDDEGDNRQPAQ
jgi:hypothetical protein